MMVNLKMLREQYVKLDEKIAKLDEETFDLLAHDSVSLGEKIASFEKGLRQWKSIIEMNNSKDPKALILKIILGDDSK